MAAGPVARTAHRADAARTIGAVPPAIGRHSLCRAERSRTGCRDGWAACRTGRRTVGPPGRRDRARQRSGGAPGGSVVPSGTIRSFEPLPRTRIVPSGRMSPTCSEATSASRSPVARRSMRERPLARIGERQEALEFAGAERCDERVRHPRSTERPDTGSRSELLRVAPIAERLQPADVAGDRLRGQRLAQFEEPGPQLGCRHPIDWPGRSESANGPAGDHSVPLDRPLRGALGGPGSDEQVDRRAEAHRERVEGASRIKRTGRGTARVRRTTRDGVRRSSHDRTSSARGPSEVEPTSSGGSAFAVP